MNPCPICKFQTYEAYGTTQTCIHFQRFRKRIKENGHRPPDIIIEAVYAPVSVVRVGPRQ